MHTTSFQIRKTIAFLTVLGGAWCGGASAVADIVDFGHWTMIEDPADPLLEAQVDSASQATLRLLDGTIGFGRDIGYASLNGLNETTSTQGYYFRTDADFRIAVDYQINFSAASGGMSIGLGIGEDILGTDSAGIALLTQNGNPATYLAAARVDDADVDNTFLAETALDTGRFLVDYQAATGDVMVGISVDGDDVAEEWVTYSNLQDSWDDEGLLVSFFARGDNGLTNWGGGTADAIFTDFHVITGSATAVPEPSTVCIVAMLAGGIALRRRRQ